MHIAHGSNRRLHSAAVFLLLACFGVSRGEATPITVGYSAVNLGSSQWTYQYTLTGTFNSEDDLAIFFPVGSSSSLTDLGTGGADWTTLALQPDSAIPADGEFDLVANVDNPSLAPTFRVNFGYSGVGTPGSQSFTLYDPTFNVIASGSTQSLDSPPIPPSPVPEPTSLALLGTGLIGLLKVARRRR